MSRLLVSSSPIRPPSLGKQVLPQFGCRMVATFSPNPSQPGNRQTLEQLLLTGHNNLQHQCHANRYPNLPAHSPINNSSPDGWGVVAYSQADMWVTKEALSALEKSRYETTCKRLGRTAPQVVLAHVRMASPFLHQVSRCNTHPFILNQWSFIHNGTALGAQSKPLQEALRGHHQKALDATPKGETDSEAAFYTFLGNLHQQFHTLHSQHIGQDGLKSVFRDTLQKLLQAHDWVKGRVSEQNRPVLNMILSDGNHMLAARMGTPFYLGKPTPHSPKGTPFVIASEPIGVGAKGTQWLQWAPIPENHTVLLSPTKQGPLQIHIEALPTPQRRPHKK